MKKLSAEQRIRRVVKRLREDWERQEVDVHRLQSNMRTAQAVLDRIQRELVAGQTVHLKETVAEWLTKPQDAGQVGVAAGQWLAYQRIDALVTKCRKELGDALL